MFKANYEISVITGDVIYFTAFDRNDEIWLLIRIYFITLLIIFILLSILFDEIKFTATWSRKYCECTICGNKCFVFNLINIDVMSSLIWKISINLKQIWSLMVWWPLMVMMKICVFDVYHLMSLGYQIQETLITLLEIFFYHFLKSLQSNLLVFACISNLYFSIKRKRLPSQKNIQ